jgi:hypothetical protein
MAGYPADRCSAHCYAVGLDKRAFKNTAVFKSGHNEIQNRPLASKTRKDPAPVPCPFRKLYPDVMVVQPRQDWDGYNDPGPLNCPT